MDTIIQAGQPVLRQIATALPPAEIGGQATLKIISRMSRALQATKDGIALAAPQIGVSRRLFIVSGKLFNTTAEGGSDLVFINPVLKKRSRKKLRLEEGCLSVRGVYAFVERSEKATIEAYDLAGRKFTHHASGLLAQIFQHEIDHLNGILFTNLAL